MRSIITDSAQSVIRLTQTITCCQPWHLTIFRPPSNSTLSFGDTLQPCVVFLAICVSLSNSNIINTKNEVMNYYVPLLLCLKIMKRGALSWVLNILTNPLDSQRLQICSAITFKLLVTFWTPHSILYFFCMKAWKLLHCHFIQSTAHALVRLLRRALLAITIKNTEGTGQYVSNVCTAWKYYWSPR